MRMFYVVRLTSLRAAFRAAGGLADTDEAFAKLPKEKLDQLLTDKEQLSKV